jgi:hypothetical protein
MMDGFNYIMSNLLRGKASIIEEEEEVSVTSKVPPFLDSFLIEKKVLFNLF